MELETVKKPINMRGKARVALREELSKYDNKFTVESTAIDYRRMVKNFDNDQIPLSAVRDLVSVIAEANDIEVANRASVKRDTLEYAPKFGYATEQELALCPYQQRGSSIQHALNIHTNIDSAVPGPIKCILDPVTGKYEPWDDLHTTIATLLQGWDRIPVWYIEEPNTENMTALELQAARVRLRQKAATNFLNTNSVHKRAVDRYDEYHIKLDAEFAENLAIESILRKMDCKTVREGTVEPGGISHIKFLLDCYNVQRVEKGEASRRDKGVYLTRALRFFRTNWMIAHIPGPMLWAFTYLLAQIDRELNLDNVGYDFEDELAHSLKDVYGSLDSIQEGFKEDFKLDRVLDKVQDVHGVALAGLVCHYRKYHNTYNLPEPKYKFGVL